MTRINSNVSDCDNLIDTLYQSTHSQVISSEPEDINYDVTRYTIHNSFVLLGSKTNLSLIETKLMRLIISNVQISPDRTEFPIYRVALPELAKKLNVSKKALQNEIDTITDNLLKSTIFLKYQNKKNEVEKYNLFSRAKFSDDYLEIKMNNDIKDLFLQLKGNFTIYEQLNLIMTYRSKHSITLSEALYASIKKNVKYRIAFNTGETVRIGYTTEELRWFTSTNNKYKDTYDLKKRVIDPAVKEINVGSELYIEKYTTEKKGSSQSANYFVFHVYNKYKRNNRSTTQDDITSMQSLDSQETLTKEFIISQLQSGGYSFNQNQIEKLLKYYHTTDDFMVDYNKAYKKSKYNIVSYMIKMAENREKTSQKFNVKIEDWDSAALRSEFDEIVAYWNDLIARIDMKRPDIDLEEDEFYNLKPIVYTDVRHRRNYYYLLESGQTKELIKKAIDTASISSYFLRTSGNFTRFINPKNYFDIAAGERDYDTEQANLWKMEK